MQDAARRSSRSDVDEKPGGTYGMRVHADERTSESLKLTDPKDAFLVLTAISIPLRQCVLVL